MQIVFLGTASCFPTPHRGVSCTALKLEDGVTWLFDCGEGSQIQLQKSVLKTGKITKIFITHLHGDHLFGLPGLMCTIGSQSPDRTGFTLEIYGPHGLRKYIRQSLALSRSPLSFNYVVHELMPIPEQYPDDWYSWEVNHSCEDIVHPQEIIGKNILPENDVWNIFTSEHVDVAAGPIMHRVPCFGFVIIEKDKPGALNVCELKKLGVPAGPLYGKLKQGESITLDSGFIDIINAKNTLYGALHSLKTINVSWYPHDLKRSADYYHVLGPPKKGRKVTILGDTHDPSRISDLAMNSDVLLHEATMEDALKEKAVSVGHSTPSMAASFAQKIKARKLILFHFSQRFKANKIESTEEVPHVNILKEEAILALGEKSDCEVVLAEDLLVFRVEQSK